MENNNVILEAALNFSRFQDYCQSQNLYSDYTDDDPINLYYNDDTKK
jgi:hypothetical protein